MDDKTFDRIGIFMAIVAFSILIFFVWAIYTLVQWVITK